MIMGALGSNSFLMPPGLYPHDCEKISFSWARLLLWTGINDRGVVLRLCRINYVEFEPECERAAAQIYPIHSRAAICPSLRASKEKTQHAASAAHNIFIAGNLSFCWVNDSFPKDA